MRRLKQVALILSAFVLTDCKKPEVSATLYVTVIRNNQVAPNPTVYLKSGGAHNPQIPLSQYEQQMTGDESGKVLFTDLPEGDYFLIATAPVPGTTVLAVGETTMSMVQKEAPNRYEKRIYVQ